MDLIEKECSAYMHEPDQFASGTREEMSIGSLTTVLAGCTHSSPILTSFIDG